MSYLGELLGSPNPTAQQTKEAAKETGATKFFPHAVDFRGDLEMAFGIWDAVSQDVPPLSVCLGDGQVLARD